MHDDTLKNASAPWNYTNAEIIKTHYSTQEINWNIVADHLQKILEVYADIVIPDHSGLPNDITDYISFSFKSISSSIKTFNDVDRSIFKQELIYQGIKEPTTEQIDWLLNSWLRHVIFEQIETIFMLIEKNKGSQTFEWLVDIVTPHILQKNSDPFLNYRVLMYTTLALREKAMPMIIEIMQKSSVTEVRNQAKSLRGWIDNL